MSRCNLAQQCVFFAGHGEGEELREYLTGRYCAGSFGECARYRAALELGQELVPDDIFPNEDDFLSLFAWSVNLRDSPGRRPCRPRAPGRLPVAAAEKPSAADGHLPRHPRSHR